MKFLTTIGIFLGLLVSLYFLDNNAPVAPEGQAQLSGTKGEKNQPNTLEMDSLSRNPASEKKSENDEDVQNMEDRDARLPNSDQEFKVPYPIRAQKYYLENSTIIATWEKRDSLHGKNVKVVLFEPKIKQKYSLLRMEKTEGVDELSSEPVFMVADHVMVTLSDQAQEVEFEKMMADLDVRIRKFQTRSHIYLVEFNGEEKGKFESVLAELNKRKDMIKYAEPDYLVSNL